MKYQKESSHFSLIFVLIDQNVRIDLLSQRASTKLLWHHRTVIQKTLSIPSVTMDFVFQIVVEDSWIEEYVDLLKCGETRKDTWWLMESYIAMDFHHPYYSVLRACRHKKLWAMSMSIHVEVILGEGLCGIRCWEHDFLNHYARRLYAFC